MWPIQSENFDFQLKEILKIELNETFFNLIGNILKL